MPLYEYECPKCGNFDKIRKFSDPPLKKCPTCGSPVAKLLSAPAIQFKGAGWYVNDYAKKAKGGEAKGGDAKGGDAKGSESKGTEAKPSETKSSESKGSESKTESRAEKASSTKTDAK